MYSKNTFGSKNISKTCYLDSFHEIEVILDMKHHDNLHWPTLSARETVMRAVRVILIIFISIKTQTVLDMFARLQQGLYLAYIHRRKVE